MKITIHQRTYSSNELKDWIENRPFNQLPEWEVAFINFLKEWFDDCEQIYAQTSGSTGSPKPILLNKKSMLASASLTNQRFGINASSRMLLCLSSNYIAGKMMIVRAIAADTELTVVEPSSALSIDQNFDFAAMVPMQIETLLRNQKGIDALEKINQVIIGGSPLSAALEQELQQVKTACFMTYGMTETVSHVALRAINGAMKSESYIALCGIQFSTDERGCLVIKAPHLQDEPFVTNDIVELISEQSFHWKGRFDHVINSGGVKLFPEMIEQKLISLIPHRFYIASKPDKLLGERAVLVMESAPYSQTEEVALLEKIANVVSKYEKPKEVIYFSSFTETSTGKIKRILP